MMLRLVGCDRRNRHKLAGFASPSPLHPRTCRAPHSRRTPLSSAMYGGDEVSALVLEVGSLNTKAGFAGEESPKAVFPSSVGVGISSGTKKVGATQQVVGDESADKEKLPDASKPLYYCGTNALAFRRDGMEVVNPLKNGLVEKWEEFEQLATFGLKNQLSAEPSEHPLLLAEPSFNTRQAREKFTELFFEKYRVPALFVAKNAVLSSFAAGKATSLVVDCGGAVSVACPVHDGYVLQKALHRNAVAGERITEEILKELKKKGVEVRPNYSIQRKEVERGKFEVTHFDFPKTAESYRLFQTLAIVRDLKETVCKVSEGTYAEEHFGSLPSVGYELPDGKHIDVRSERFRIPELLFDTDPLEDAKENPGLGTLVQRSLLAVDADLRKELLQNVLVTGGTSLLPGFVDRLTNELTAVNLRIRALASNVSPERKFSSWIGGSILGSLGSFQQMWMSKQEYEEHGRSLVERKCP